MTGYYHGRREAVTRFAWLPTIIRVSRTDKRKRLIWLKRYRYVPRERTPMAFFGFTNHA